MGLPRTGHDTTLTPGLQGCKKHTYVWRSPQICGLLLLQPKPPPFFSCLSVDKNMVSNTAQGTIWTLHPGDRCSEDKATVWILAILLTVQVLVLIKKSITWDKYGYGSMPKDNSGMGSRTGASPPFHDRAREEKSMDKCTLRGARCFESLPRTVLQRPLPLRANRSCSCWSGILIFQGPSAQLATLPPL